MDFVVENVSVDSFYLNLLLEIPKILDKNRRIGVKKRYLSRFTPVAHSDICTWEQKHGILLPDDLRNFYNSTDGFLFKWMCTYGSKFQFDSVSLSLPCNLTAHQLNITAKIEINSLQNLVHLTGFQTKSDPGVQLEGKRYKLRLGHNSKIFELCALDDDTKITLVYLNTRFMPTVWLYTKEMEFYYLADNFTTYFRMCVAHLGFPNWQLLYTAQGVPEWTRILMRLIAPRLLQQNKKTKTIETMKKDRSKKKIDGYANVAVNKLDINVFKYHSRPSRNAATVVRRDEKSPSPTKSPRKKKYYWVKSRYLKKPPYHNITHMKTRNK